MKCPNCKEHNLVISERKGIEIDYCPECRGIWLDRGELDKIFEKSRVEEGSHSQNHSQSPRQDSRQDYSREHKKTEYYEKPYKRKKSFLEEIFD